MLLGKLLMELLVQLLWIKLPSRSFTTLPLLKFHRNLARIKLGNSSASSISNENLKGDFFPHDVGFLST